MIRLSLLGGLGLVGVDGQTIEPVLQQPKRLALLVYLALSDRGTFRRRDTALLLFWPEATERRARNSLSQGVHFLRRWLGPAAIVDRGPGELVANADFLWCDAVAFTQAFNRGEWREALRLYRGDLLAGFSISAGPEFEQWLDAQRSQVRRDAASAAWRLVDSAEANGQRDAAVQWARRAVELSPNDERALQRLLATLERFGDRAGAMAVYTEFATRLDRECQTRPSTETMRVVARIRAGVDGQIRIEEDVVITRGIVDDQMILTSVKECGVGEPAPGPGGMARANLGLSLKSDAARVSTNKQLGRRWVWAAGAAACLLGILSLHRALRTDRAITSERSVRIVIQHLATPGGTSASTSLAAALTSAVIDQLASVRSLDIVDEPLRRIVGPPQRAGPLNPQLVVAGDVLQSAGGIRVAITVADASSGRVVRTAAFDHLPGPPLSLVDTLSHEIAAVVRIAAGDEVQRREWKGRANSESAYDLVQQANDARDRADELERSGDIQTALQALQSSDSLLGAAARVSPEWGVPSVQRANLSKRLATLYMVSLRNPARAEAQFRAGIGEASHAVSLDPHDASALDALGALRYWYWLLMPVTTDSASHLLVLAEGSLRAAVAADPGRASAWSLLSAALYAHADYSGAYLSAMNAFAADAYLQNSQDVLQRLFLSSYEMGDDSASGYWCNESGRRFARSWPSAYCALALLAWNLTVDTAAVNRAWTIADEAISRAPQAQQAQQVQPRFYMLVATVLARHGMRDSAESLIRQARNDGAGDDELLPLEADARIALRERAAAAELLARYVRRSPARRFGVAHSRRFVTLREIEPDTAHRAQADLDDRPSIRGFGSPSRP